MKTGKQLRKMAEAAEEMLGEIEEYLKASTVEVEHEILQQASDAADLCDRLFYNIPLEGVFEEPVTDEADHEGEEPT